MNLVIQSEIDILIEKQLESIVKKLEEKYSCDIMKFNFSDDFESVIEEVSTYPLFSDHKVIICEEANFITAKGVNLSDDDVSLFLESIKNCTFATIILTVDKIDKRKKISKAIESEFKIITLNNFSEDKIIQMIISKLNGVGKEIHVETANYFAQILNYNLSIIYNELDKLMLVDGNIIDNNIISKLVVKTLESNVFEFTNCLLKDDKMSAYKVYQDLIMNKEEPIALIAMMANQLRMILQVYNYKSLGYSSNDIAKTIDVHPFRIKLIISALSNFNIDNVEKKLINLATLDYKIKTGYVDKNVGVELFLLG